MAGHRHRPGPAPIAVDDGRLELDFAEIEWGGEGLGQSWTVGFGSFMTFLQRRLGELELVNSGLVRSLP